MGRIPYNPVLLVIQLITGKGIVEEAEEQTMQSRLPECIGDWETNEGGTYIGIMLDEPGNLLSYAPSHDTPFPIA